MRVIQPTETAGPLAGTAATLIPDAAGATALALMGLLADSVTVQVMANGTSVYNQTVATAGRQALVFEDLPGIPQSTVTVTLGGAAPAAALVAIGPLVWLGITNTGPTVGITDYSLRTTDDFGVTTVVQRDWAKTLSLTFNAESAAADAVEQALATLRAKACVWIADESLDSLILYGIIKDWSVPFRLNSSVPFALTLTGYTEVETTVAGSGDPAPDAIAGRLQILVPLALTDDVLVSSTVPETVPAWDAGVNYAADQTAMIAHRVYQALTPNTGIDPTTDSATWLDTGPTSRWAPFDQALGTAATLTGTITYVFQPYAGVAALAAVDVVGATVRVRSGSYDETRVPSAGASLFLDLAVPAGQQITVDIAPGADGNAAVGTLLFGSLLSMGLMEDAPNVSITDYSGKAVDTFGNITPVERAWAKKMEANTLITRAATDDVVRRMAAIRATPVLWIGEEAANLVTMYGFYRDFSAAIDVNTAVCTLTIEGLSAAGPAPASILAVPWDGVTDPLGTKPANNATNTGDPTSAFGGAGGTVQSTLDQQAAQGSALATAQSQIAAAESNISTLIDEVTSATGTIAESEASAEAAATAAQAASSAAATAQSNAATARDQAQAAFTGADAARTAALDAENVAVSKAQAADGSATAAAGSAVLASSSADQSGQQASIATGAAVQAKASSDASQSSAGASSTSAQAAQASAGAAGSSASSAATSQQAASLSAAASKAQADASAGSASSAAVFQSGAGQSASAAQGSAVQAATSAGQAGTFAGNAGASASQAATSQSSAAGSSNTATQASTLAAASQAGAAGSASAADSSAHASQSSADAAGASASSAQSSANQAQGYSSQASSSAASSSSQAAIAQSNAAAALQSASLSASIGPGVLNQNPSFAIYSAASGAPDGWTGWDYTTGTPYRVPGLNGIPFSVRMDTPGGPNCGIVQFIDAAAGKYVVEVTADLLSGTYDGAGVILQWNNVSGGNANGIGGYALDFLNTADTAGYTGNGGFRRSWSVYVDTGVNGSINQLVLYAIANWSGFPTALSAKSIVFRTLRVRMATAAEIAGQRADGNASIALSQIATEQSVRASQVDALASSQSTMQSQIAGNTAGLNSEAQTRASNDAAQSARSDLMQAQVTAAGSSTACLNANASFSAYPQQTGLPSGWQDWSSGSNASRVAGRAGGYGYQGIVADGADQGLVQTLYLTAGDYIIEADIWCEQGDWQGAGIAVGASSVGFVATVNFATDASLEGLVGAQGPGIRRWRSFVSIAYTGDVQFYMMTGWDGFGSTHAKTLDWYLCGIRAASAAETAGKRADANANSALAQITTEQSVRASQTAALATRADNMQSSIDGQAAQISQNATTASDATAALAQQVTTLQAQSSGLSATVSSQAAALADAQGKLRAWFAFRAAAGDANASIEAIAYDDNGNAISEIDFIANRLVFRGQVIGLDNLLPNAKSFRRGASDGNAHAITDQQTIGPIAVIATAGIFTSSHYLELDYALTLSGGRNAGTQTEPDPHPFSAGMQLAYRPQGSSWQVLPEVVGLGGGIGTRGVSDRHFFDAGDWGLCDIGLYFVGVSGDGTNGQISNLSYTLKANAYA